VSPSRPLRLLLVGPLPVAGDVIGGTKVSFAAMVAELRRAPGFEVDVVSTSRARAGHRPWATFLLDALALARVALTLLLRAGRADVLFLTVSSRGALRLGPLAWLAATLHRVPLAVRLWGGDLDLELERTPAPLRALARRTFLRAPLLLLQTQALCDAVPSAPGRRFFPTTRELPPAQPRTRAADGARRFVYVGQMRPEKGLREALAASDALPADAVLELHGPPMPGFEACELEGHPRALCRGPLAPEDVPRLLARSDVLVFPSYHPGEGLPGVVVEALQSGLPVVAARWRALPELVRHGENGLLVAPRSVDELRAALLALAADGELVQRLADGAVESGEAFRASRWQPQLERWLRELARTDTGTEHGAEHALEEAR